MYRETIENFADAGAHKAVMVKTNLVSFLVGAAMAGAYIGFGDILMFTVGAHADPAWAHLIMGSVFASALTIVIFAGSELFTGTAMYMPFAVFSRKATIGEMLSVWATTWLGNLVGAIVLAAIFHMAGGGVLLGDGREEFFSVVTAKMSAPALQLFARGVLCNWLVCLAIWMCARTDNAAAKIMLIFWPITIFIAAGYEHSVANMFTFSMALMGDHPASVTYAGALNNLVWVTLGNLVGGTVMMAMGYWIQDEGIGHVSYSKAPVAATTRNAEHPKTGVSHEGRS
ncbi:formate/nitrite transporter family protein [Rhizobium sp. Root1220]|uniref:formate/nitrite transporter family protein n=1 Tax=Rhizobium sp. Root1220 TaxID=1736432 RepID=UPI0006FAA7EF|nr:formate/nitrite transporter family protein [Rhizobium sp. Root1220]KQV70213.1 nitrite transporter NirC [Rhizobium sp. Root1220]